MSTYTKQRTGIRQGCPLSPYLFVSLMTVLIADVKEELGEDIIESPEHIAVTELLYADDTLLMTIDQESMNKLVQAIEKISAEYNMKLNLDKCFHISMNCEPTIRFRNGKPMASATQVTYLGGTITNKGCPRTEIQSRLSKALGAAKKLITVWKDVNCDIKWKLQVYNAVIITQLTYALDSVYIFPKMANKLDAFQNRSLRFSAWESSHRTGAE